MVGEDWPSARELAALGLDVRGSVYGLYQGSPLPVRSVFADAVYPDRISIYRGPLTRDFGYNPTELVRQIRITVLHEIGHHFGLSDDDMQHLEGAEDSP